MSNRYLTTETYAGEVRAFTEVDWPLANGIEDLADWVWQWADSEEQAISQHADKVDAWHLDPTRETY